MMTQDLKKPVEDIIKTRLSQALDLVYLDVENQSHLHAGHQAMKDVSHQESHFKLSLWASEFEGLRLLDRQRLVYKILDDLIPRPIHAVTLKIQMKGLILSKSHLCIVNER